MLHLAPESYRHIILQEARHSITHTLLEVTKEITLVNDSELYVCSVFLDLLKALDTATYEIVLIKLEYGYKEVTKRFLKGENQYTTFQGTKFEENLINCDVSQDSALGYVYS